MMTVQQVRDALSEACKQGVREYYFTGGEPFMHPDIRELISMTLAQGPLTILTNGILINDEQAVWLAETFRTAPYSLDLRISLDGMTAEENDPIRGKNTFRRITAGIACLARHGVNPVITVTEVRPEMGRPANNGQTTVWYALLTVHSEEEHVESELLPVAYDHERFAYEMRQEKLPEEFVETILTGWWTTCLEILPSRERARGHF